MSSTVPRFGPVDTGGSRLDDRALADLDFVLAVVKDDDRLHDRAVRWLDREDAPPVVPFSVGLELLLWCRDHAADPVPAVDAAVRRLDVEEPEMLVTAARLLRDARVRSPFDALNVARAEHRGVNLLTRDDALRGRGLPVERF